MNSHLTAMTRRVLPLPVRWLLKQNLIHGRVLDYGCGKCQALNEEVLSKHPGVFSVESYDPYYAPGLSRAHLGYKWDVILCTYVLGVLPQDKEFPILLHLQSFLNPDTDGVVYITVRREPPKKGWGLSARGTLQRYVCLPYLPIMHRTKQFAIYVLTHNQEIPIVKA